MPLTPVQDDNGTAPDGEPARSPAAKDTAAPPMSEPPPGCPPDIWAATLAEIEADGQAYEAALTRALRPRHVVFSVGYAGVPIEAFQAFVEREDLRVVDIRFKPASRVTAYSRKRLRERFGDRYTHLPALGNRNYRGGPIALLDAARGLREVRALLAEGPIALLCVCRDWQTCHRTVITDALGRQGHEVRHVVPT
jgi:hypothetical protein